MYFCGIHIGIQSTIDHGQGLLHPFPNQDGSLVRGGLPIDRSPWSMEEGSLMGWWIDFL